MAAVETSKMTLSVVDLLGGRKALRREIADSSSLREAVRRGLPFRSLAALANVLEVTAKDLAALLGVASRTLARRKAARHLSPIESDRLYRIAFVVWLASQTLGSVNRAESWLKTPNRALGGQTPLSLLDTEIGERQVEDVLNRISFGVYS